MGSTVALSRRLLTRGALALLFIACKSKDAAVPAADTASAASGAAATPGQTLNTGTPVDGNATLTVPVTAGAGAEIQVGWTGPANQGDYIDLVPRGTTATSGEITYAYTRDAVPVAKLKVPTNPGDYDVRYILQLENERKIKATSQITVTAVTARITVPDSAEGGEPLSIAWEGPSAQGDYIDIVPAGHSETSGEITYAYTRDGTPAKLTAPGKSGSYEIRYLLEGTGGRKVLTSAPIRVVTPVATLKAPDAAPRSSKLAVEWTGPKRRGDYVDLVKKGHTETSGEIAYFYTDRNNPSELTLPAEPGEYEIRYILEAPGGRQVLARRPLRVR